MSHDNNATAPWLGRLASREDVYDRYESHLHEGVIALLPATLEQITAAGRQFIVETVDHGRIIGATTSLVTRPGDEIIFAQRAGRAGWTRFVKGREPEASSELSVVLMVARNEPGYVCLSAWIGGPSRPEPWDPKPAEDSLEFWLSHALVWDPDEIVPGTETPDCPW